MKKDEHFSEEQLNAFVDGELDPEEKSRLYNESSRSPELDKRLCQHRKLKELVRHAYDDVPEPTRPHHTSLDRTRMVGRALVASVLLAVGVLIGSAGTGLLEFGTGGNGGASVAGHVSEPENYLLHVISGDPEQMHAALEYAQFLLESVGDGEVGQVEIVANERGLDLLRSDVTPFAAEIAELQAHDVVFYACSRTIERLEEEGVNVVLVPHTRVDYTALDRVVMRMQEGWKYEKI